MKKYQITPTEEHSKKWPVILTNAEVIKVMGRLRELFQTKGD